MSRAPASGPVLLLAGLALFVAFVIAVLPRWMAPPVLTTGSPTASKPSSLPATSSSVAASPAASTPAPQPTEESVPRRVDPLPHASSPAARDDWSAAVSAGFAALERGAFAEALDTFTRADAARPGTAAVADGLVRARAGLLEEALNEHRSKAEAAEAREEWPEALAEYDAALRLEPAVAFAVDGRTRCAQRAALDERLRRYLVKPERLSAEAVAREAAAVLEQAGEVQPAGPRLVAQRTALESLLAGMRQPVPVRLVSDGLTQVTILRVGPLGAFKERAIELRPGSYVVVGARTGYRDTRRTLVVPIGRSPAALDVRCDEAH